MRSSLNGWTEIPGPSGPATLLDKNEVVSAMREQRARTLALFRAIPETDWERIVVPRWRLREVAAHLVTTDEGALTGRLLTAGFSRDGAQAVSKIEAWNDRQVSRWADRPIPELLRGLEVWAKRMERLAGVVPQGIVNRGLPTPFGRVSLAWLASMRIYDEWVHIEDVRRAYGLPSDDDRTSLRPIGRQLLAGLPIQTIPRVPAGARGRVSLAMSDIDLPALGFDLGGHRYGLGVEGSDARITGSVAGIAMVAARRDPWQDAETAGALKVEGDRTAAEALLDALLLV
jgi:uncharacterized protein (TIGR03083 family)